MRFILTAAAFWAAFFMAGIAAAACRPHDDALKFLFEKYNEVPVAAGVSASGALIELTRSPHGETWTLIVTNSQGITCSFSAGEGWRNLSAKPPDGPET